MNILLVGVAAFLGAIAVALLGWLNQIPPADFKLRLFSSSVITAIIAAVGIAAAFNYSGASSPLMYLFAFLSGAGTDAGRSRIGGAIITIITKIIK